MFQEQKSEFLGISAKAGTFVRMPSARVTRSFLEAGGELIGIWLFHR